jgi:hypothetical protein
MISTNKPKWRQECQLKNVSSFDFKNLAPPSGLALIHFKSSQGLYSRIPLTVIRILFPFIRQGISIFYSFSGVPSKTLGALLIF